MQEAQTAEAVTQQICQLLKQCAGTHRLCLVIDNAEDLFDAPLVQGQAHVGTPPVTHVGSAPVHVGTPPVHVGTPPVHVGSPPVHVGSPPVAQQLCLLAWVSSKSAAYTKERLALCSFYLLKVFIKAETVKLWHAFVCLSRH